MDDVARSLHHDWQENPDGSVTITTRQDIAQHIKAAAEARSADALIGRQASEGAGMHMVGSIPGVIVQKWKDEGFDIHSAERSKMTAEEHQREILKRLCGEYSVFNTSRFARLT